MSNDNIEKMERARINLVYAFIDYHRNCVGIKKLVAWQFCLIFERAFMGMTSNFSVRELIRSIREICDKIEILADDFEKHPRNYD